LMKVVQKRIFYASFWIPSFYLLFSYWHTVIRLDMRLIVISF
jgi:hypothetical protein